MNKRNYTHNIFFSLYQPNQISSRINKSTCRKNKIKNYKISLNTLFLLLFELKFNI